MIYMNRILLFIMFSIFLFSVVFGSPFEYRYAPNGYKYVHHNHSESSFQHAHCSSVGGIEEYELKDKTRVDCLTKKYAIEYDFANKSYEAVGQALYYGLMTRKIPKVVLILDSDRIFEQMIYFDRIKRIAKKYNFEVEYISDNLLNIEKDFECEYNDCKCHYRKI